jgi:hypothetical protein
LETIFKQCGYDPESLHQIIFFVWSRVDSHLVGAFATVMLQS